MKKSNNFIFAFYLLFPLLIYSQDITIDYVNYTSPPNCTNTFASIQTIDNIEHKSELGAVLFDSSNNYLKLNHDYNGSISLQKGTMFSIGYNFKKNYTYKVIITAKNSVSPQIATGLQLGFFETNLSNSCSSNSPEIVHVGQGFSIDNVKYISSNNFTEYTFNSSMILSNWYKLDIGTYTESNTATNPIIQNIYIKKIKIIEIPPPPTFTLSSSTTSIDCNSTAPITFTITNVNNSPGTLTYNWQVGSGWLYNGNAVSNFTTSTNSVTLVPTTFPPSAVKLTPVLDGVSFPQLTSTINLSDFSLDNQRIIGASTVCSSRDYTLNGLPSDTTITWSVSNTNIATVTPINSSQATVTATGNGVITLTALVTNSCNQAVELTKTNINIGSPSFASGSMTGESNPFTGDFEQYTVPVASGASNYDWYFDVGGVLGTSIDGWEIIYAQGTFVNITVGNPGLAILVCKVTNSCGSATKYKYITAHSTGGGGSGGGTDPCLTSLKFSSNPMKSEVSTNKIIIIDDPCLTPSMKNAGITTTNHTITIFNRNSTKVYSKTQKDKEFNINNLPKGFYIVKYKNTKGRTITKNLLIN